MNTSREGWRQGRCLETSFEDSTASSGTSTSGEYNEAGSALLNCSSPITQFASVTQGVVTAATGAGLTIVLRRAFTGNTTMSSGPSLLQGTDTATVTTAPAPPAPATPPPPPQPDGKPAHDVVAGAVARAASQSTIHPLDTMKVRMQAGRSNPNPPPKVQPKATSSSVRLERQLLEVRGLYKGVVGAATGAGIIIGTYFAFYSTTKRFLREKTDLHEGASAFVAGAAAALGSSVVKVPLAVCIRSVQAGIYKNVFHAAKSIVNAAGVRGLFTGFLPTVLEDVPDMAVKFAVYETLRKVHANLRNRPANVAEDLIMGGFAGAAAAAATTPLDVLKTVMMCSASSRPTLAGAARSIMREGKGLKPFFRGVGPRALSNGLNSAIFFCFFEAIRQVLIKKQEKAALLELQAGIHAHPPSAKQEARGILRLGRGNRAAAAEQQQLAGATLRPAGTAAACLSLALPAPGWHKNE